MKTIFICLIFLLAGCTITGRISRREMGAEIAHIPRPKAVERQEPEWRSNYIEYVDNDGSTQYLVPVEDGIPIFELEPIIVTAPSRTIPERNGTVNLDFVVTLPKQLMGSCRSVDVTPILRKQSESIPLQNLTIRGALFNKVQARNYWQYDRYLDLFNPDENGRDWAYERFIRYPYPEGTRLDSVVPNKTNISYYYTQEIPTAEAESNKLLITLQGRVSALDRSEYRFPLSDTLEFNISSMLTFTDTTPRFITRVIDKFLTVNDKNYLNFVTNKSEIIDTLSDNKMQLSHIEKLMDEIINQKEFHVDSIVLTASASPEGAVSHNMKLSNDRANALRKRLGNADIIVRSVGEDWTELARLINANNNIKNRAEIVQLIATIHNRDALENEIKHRYPSDYNYIFENLYPQLRAVTFTYNLRRVGMIKDTIHTTVPDTLYARGVTLLKARKYTDALAILGGFRDRNSAICMLSLGMDSGAYELLKSLPENSINLYLLAIACARLGRHDEALQHFDRAAELNPNLLDRARLDPEISQLLKTRNHEN